MTDELKKALEERAKKIAKDVWFERLAFLEFSPELMGRGLYIEGEKK